MSVFRWKYTEECEGRYCCGDCDKCDKEDEPVDDLIRRQDVIDMIMGDGIYCDTDDDKKYSVERIMALSAVEPRKGKWVPHKVNAYTEWGSDCSECGEWFVVDRLVLGEKYHICPNCGAKMEE